MSPTTTAEFFQPETTPQNRVNGQYYSTQCSALLLEAAIPATFETGPPTAGELTEVSLPEMLQSKSVQLEYPSVSVQFLLYDLPNL